MTTERQQQQQQYYVYAPLKRGQSQNDGTAQKESTIRLLNLHPGERSDTLLGSLIVRDKEEYEALSYSWGDPLDDKSPTIGLLENNKSRQLKITKNLASALRYLRDPVETKVFWVDAISIDQKNKNEKSHQIPMMGKIYSEATNVCIWLGEENDTSGPALEHIKSVLDLQQLDRLVSEAHTADWAALSALMRRDWFSRRWVVQEIAFAQRAFVHCGEQKIPWSHLADAVALFSSRAEEIAELFRGDKKYNNQGDFLGDVEALGATRLVQTISKLFRKSDKGKKLEPLLSLEALVSNLSAFNASKPHDIIYAILSLANDTVTSARDSETVLAPTPSEIPKFKLHDTSVSDASNNTARAHVSTLDSNGSFRPRTERRLSIASPPLLRAASPAATRRQNMARSRSRSRGRSEATSDDAGHHSRGAGNSSHTVSLRGDDDIVREIMRTEEFSKEQNMKIKIFNDETEVRHALRRIRACKIKPRDPSMRRYSGPDRSKSADKLTGESGAQISYNTRLPLATAPDAENKTDNAILEEGYNGMLSPTHVGRANRLAAEESSNEGHFATDRNHHNGNISLGGVDNGGSNGTRENGFNDSDGVSTRSSEDAPIFSEDPTKASTQQPTQDESTSISRGKISDCADEILPDSSTIPVSDSDEFVFSPEVIGDLSPPRDLWDEETLELLKEGGDHAIFQLTRNLLHIQRTLKMFVVDRLKKRVERKTFQVDYDKKKFYEVCRDFIEFTINQSKSLDMLCRPWAPDVEDRPPEDRDELPSWVCPLSLSPFRPRHDGNYGRVNADLLVGMPDERGKTYNASATTKPENFEFKQHSLLLRGFILDTIEDVRTEAIEGNVPHDWLKLGGWENLRDDPPESFWRTLVADRDENGRNPPSYYQRACQYAFTQRVTGGSLNTERLISNDKSKIMTKYLKRVQAVVWMRKLIKTKPQTNKEQTNTEPGRLGLAPQRAQVGDKICILRGCSVPVVLRKIVQSEAQKTEQATVDLDPPEVGPNIIRRITSARPQDTGIKFEKSGPYRLIGECYIHGVMDGEAFKIRDEFKLKEMEFEIL